MYYFVLVVCLIGVFLASSGASLRLEQGLVPGLKVNESMKEQSQKEKDIIDQYVITNMEPDMDSIIHSKHKIGSGGQVEDSRIKPFSLESFLNLFNVDTNTNGPSPLDSKDNLTNAKNENVRYGESIMYEIDMKMLKENKSESQESESIDQQSPALSSDGLLEQHESSLLKHNAENVQLVADITGYANFLEETYDRHLKNILNITHNLETLKQHINNKTHEEWNVEEASPGDVMGVKDSESTTNIKEENVNDDDSETSTNDRKIKKENLIKVENGVKASIILGDLVIKERESSTGEQQNQQSEGIVNSNRIKGDVPNGDNSNHMTSTDQNDGNTDKASTAPAIQLENSTELLLSNHNHGVDAVILKKEGNLEINTMNISADPCINFHCKRGKMCKTDGHGNPFCICQDPDYCLPGNKNDLVCGTDNKTYTSACHLFGTKCHLEGTKEGSHLHLDYQGPCKYIPPCTEYELAHFPFRMRDWLKNVLMQLYERDQENNGLLSEKQKSKVKKIYENEKRLHEGDHNIELLVKDFQKNYHMYVYPVHWQFHQLDQHFMDRLLTHSELAALRVPLIPIEHCVNTFLQECNTNNDRHISLWEWCRCFGIKEGDIDEDLLF